MTGSIWYFAHPYSVQNAEGRYVFEAEEANFQLCCQRAARLFEAGYNVYAPICHTHPIHRASPLFLSRHEHEAWYQLDNALIDACQWAGIILAPGWQDSAGCVAERERFRERGFPAVDFAEALAGSNRMVSVNQ